MHSGRVTVHVTRDRSVKDAASGRKNRTCERGITFVYAAIMDVNGSKQIRETRVLVLYTGGTIGMKKTDGGRN